MLNVFRELSRAIGRSMFDVPSLLSTNFCTKGEKHAFARALDNTDFRSPLRPRTLENPAPRRRHPPRRPAA